MPMEIPNQGTKLLLVTSGVMNSKNLVSGIDLYNIWLTSPMTIVRADGTTKSIAKPQINRFMDILNKTKYPKLTFVDKIKPQTIDEMYVRKGDTRQTVYYHDTELYLVEQDKYDPYREKDSCVKTLFPKFDFKYLQFSPRLFTGLCDRHDIILSGVRLSVLRDRHDPKDKNASWLDLIEMWVFDNGRLMNIATQEILPAGEELALFYVVYKMQKTDTYMLVYNEEYVVNRLVPNSYHDGVYISIIKQFSTTPKHQIFNPLFINAEGVVGKYNVHVKENWFELDLFSELSPFSFETTASIGANLDKFPTRNVVVRSPMSYNTRTVSYGGSQSFRIRFDSSNLLPGEKTWIKVMLDFGGAASGIKGEGKMAYEYIVCKTANSVTVSDTQGKSFDLPTGYTTYTDQEKLELFGNTDAFANDRITFSKD